MRGMRIRVLLTILVLACMLAPAVTLAQGSTTYTVQPGDSLRAIAQAYDVTIDALVAANGLPNPDAIYSGQVLTIPGGAGEATAPAEAPPAGATTYTVQPGDTLASIADSYGISVVALMDANGVDDADLVRSGQVLIIPSQAGDTTGTGSAQPADTPAAASSAPPATAMVAVAETVAVTETTAAPAVTATPSPTPEGPKTYTVQPGDTLASIARAQNISIAALMNANGLTDPDLLRVGQQLILSSSAPLSAAASERGQVRYTVKKGETLNQIAARYGLSAVAIARTNNLSSPDLISTGMELVIPAHITSPMNWPGRANALCGQHFTAAVLGLPGRCDHCRLAMFHGEGWHGDPVGSYHIQTKLEKAYGSTWNFWMPYWLGIYYAGKSEDGIHGLPFRDAGNWKLWEGLVGTPVTYGCVLLDDANAKALYDMAYVGMPVIIEP